MKKKLMFEKEDVTSVLHPLARLMRVLFHKEGITHDDFVNLHTQYYSRESKDPVSISHDKNNLRRNLEDPIKFTFRTFYHVIINILFKDVVRISVTVIDRKTGEEKTYHSDDKLDEPTTSSAR
jgi:hypothetical protein